MNKIAIISLSLLALTGCFRHTYHVGQGAPEGEIVYRQWHHHWIFGLIGAESVDQVIELEKLCPSGHATIHEEVTFLNGLVDVLIGIIYSPTTVTIRCSEGPESRDISLSREEVMSIVHSPHFLDAVQEKIPERLDAVLIALGQEASAPGQMARLSP